MKTVRYEKLLRLGKRGLEISQTPNLHPVLAAAAPRVKTSYQLFADCLEELVRMNEATRKEVEQGEHALGVLSREYDIARAAILSNHVMASFYLASSHYSVPEDLLETSRQTLSLLNSMQKEDWAQVVLPVFSPALAQAEQQWTRAMVARSDFQKLLARLRELADSLEATINDFRRLVRAAYGSSSREYQLMRACRNHTNDSEVPAPLINLQDQGQNQGQNTPKSNAA
jgi:hypothetical protein